MNITYITVWDLLIFLFTAPLLCLCTLFANKNRMFLTNSTLTKGTTLFRKSAQFCWTEVTFVSFLCSGRCWWHRQWCSSRRVSYISDRSILVSGKIIDTNISNNIDSPYVYIIHSALTCVSEQCDETDVISEKIID